ncbi:MAG: hypothetical protein JXP34_15890, partial [Planctomycetes bacterium]|nr:hypothetical protein [Planctomycetota bacterium]
MSARPNGSRGGARSPARGTRPARFFGGVIRSALLFAVLAVDPAGAAGWSDGFEDYPAGEPIAGRGIWKTWSGGSGTVEDGFVSDAQAATGTNSLAIVSSNDVVATFDGMTEGLWLVKAKVYVPSDQQGEL